MATRSGGSKSAQSARKRTTARTSAKTKAKPKRAASTRARKTTTSSASRASAGRSDKSVQAFRDALERSRTALESNVTVPRDRMQEVVDDAVKRGRMTRDDANELVSNLVSRSRKATDDLIRDLERLLEQARKEVEGRTNKARKELESRTTSTRKQATRAAERVGRAARDAADRPLAEADKLRRRTGAPGPPISGYEQLTAAQIKSRLKDLNKADLRKVRTQEKRGKARKGILDAIDKQLG
jgi:polyhydroxyalkanoate synthesis regulator phasin